MKTFSDICVFALVLVASLLLPPALLAQNAPVTAAQRGQAAYTKATCNTCHGVNGEGAIGPRIGPPELAFADFAKYVRMPEGKMTAFSMQAVSEADLSDIYAWLRTKSGPAQPAFIAAPGNADHGKQIYTAYGCNQCHGNQGQGSTQTFAPHIGPPGLSLVAFAAYIRQPTAIMPPYTAKAVSDQDVADIYAFLKTIPPPPAARDIPLLNQ